MTSVLTIGGLDILRAGWIFLILGGIVVVLIAWLVHEQTHERHVERRARRQQRTATTEDTSESKTSLQEGQVWRGRDFAAAVSRASQL